MDLGYIILYVPDTLLAVEFYEAAFGLERQFVHPSTQYAQMNTGATALAFADEGAAPTAGAFALNRPAPAKAAGAEIAFVAADVDAAYARAIAAGATPVAPPSMKPWGQTVSYVRDLNGFLVEICSAIKT